MTAQLTFDYLQQHRQPANVPRRRICDLPAEERPLYRLHHNGANALTTIELLALALGGSEAPGLSEDLLQRFGSLHQLARAGKAQLMKIRGIGEAQAARLLALMELSRRLQLPPADERLRITSPSDAANLMTPRMRHLQQEELHVVLLDTRNQVMGIQAIYRGSLNTSVVRIGEIFRPAIEAPAAAVIIAHNHPSGCVDASPEDVHVTREIVKAGQLLGIDVLDHIIVGAGIFLSMKERQLGFD